MHLHRRHFHKYMCVYIYTYIYTHTKREREVVVYSLSRIWLRDPWTVTFQGPPLMGLLKQEYWSGLLFPSPGDIPNPGIEPSFPALQVDSLPLGLM